MNGKLGGVTSVVVAVKEMGVMWNAWNESRELENARGEHALGFSNLI